MKTTDEQTLEKAIVDEWHAIRVILTREQSDPDVRRVFYRLLASQQVILESIYYLRTGRVLKP